MKKKLTIDGMSCMHCVNRVYHALMNISEVTSVDIDLKTQIAFLESNKTIDNDTIKSAISDVGYKVTEIGVCQEFCVNFHKNFKINIFKSN